jgi:putative ABC transport system permease protein
MEIRPILSALLRNKTGPILVALQVALSLAILANALHIVQDRRAIVTRPSGLADEHATFHITVRTLNTDTPAEQLAAMKRQADILRAVPGVKAVANVSQMPLSQSGWMASVGIDRHQQHESAHAGLYLSGDALVDTFGLKLVDGRDFLPQERVDFDQTSTTDIPAHIMLTRPLAEKLWPGQSAVGKSLFFGLGDAAQAIRVVGVVDRLQTAHVPAGPDAEYSAILPARLYGSGQNPLFAIRTEPGQRERVMKEAEAALRKSLAMPMVLRLRTVDEDRANRYRADVALQWMLVTVSVLLLLVTCSGIVGMASLWVTQRRKQIGVRRALGARRLDILRYFISENLMITSAGVAGGVILGLALNALLVSRLEMARLPAGYLAGGALLLWLLGVLAAWGPAWRAASISPATATRSI